ncbi:MAG TPA: hypothetical protein VJ302_16765 [Blastocatellia bacterium]|nr:hypothetical protein [Blastocatellia bacterium]
MPSKISNLSQFEHFREAHPKYDINTASEVFFGSLDYEVPPGAKVISRQPGKVKYIDADGYTHDVLMQSEGPQAGNIIDNTNRPKVLPQSAGELDFAKQLVQQLSGVAGQQSANALAQARGENPAALDTGVGQYLQQISGIAQQLQQPAALAALDPETKAALDAINAAEQARLAQQFDDDQASQLARLFGNRIQQSSIATGALSRLLQDQGLVSAQQLSNAAQRELTTRQFLTEQGLSKLQAALQGLGNAANTQLGSFQASNAASQGQINTLAGLLSTLTSQATQRDLAGANIDQQLKDLQERARQFNVNYEFSNTAADIAVKKANEGDSFLKKALGAAAGIALAPATGGASLGSIPGIINS